jgi:predicted CoA-binding protein
MTLQAKTAEFLAQKRLAVVGVRSTRDDAANGIFRKLRDAGYTVFPVNPSAESVEGVTCYPTVQAIPDGVEGAVIVTRPEITDQVVRDCAEAGVKYVWMHKGMGNSVSETAVQFCRDNGIEVIPGACPLMYCEPVDIFHRCFRGVLGVFGKLPKVD